MDPAGNSSREEALIRKRERERERESIEDREMMELDSRKSNREVGS